MDVHLVLSSQQHFRWLKANIAAGHRYSRERRKRQRGRSQRENSNGAMCRPLMDPMPIGTSPSAHFKNSHSQLSQTDFLAELKSSSSCFCGEVWFKRRLKKLSLSCLPAHLSTNNLFEPFKDFGWERVWECKMGLKSASDSNANPRLFKIDSTTTG